MISKRAANEWTDDACEPKDGSKGAKQLRAVLETCNLCHDLDHRDNYFYQRPVISIIIIITECERNTGRTDARGTHAADCAPRDELVHVLSHATNKGPRLKNDDG